MTLKKQERKERLIKIYKMLRIEGADKEKLKEIRDQVSLLLGEDTGLFIIEND